MTANRPLTMTKERLEEIRECDSFEDRVELLAELDAECNEHDKTHKELEWYKTNLAVSQALIHKIQETVHDAYEKDERWSDFDVLDQGVHLIKQERDKLREELVQLRESYRELEPCGHPKNFLIGDEHGHFTCLVCKRDKLREVNIELKKALRPFAKRLSHMKEETGLDDPTIVFSYGYALCKLGDFTEAYAALALAQAANDLEVK